MTPYTFVTIDCPDTGRPITVARSVRDDPIGAANQISRHQYEAVAAYQADHEALSGSLRAPSCAPGDVAGWRGRRPAPDRLRKPRDRLTRAHAALGPDRSRLIHAVLIDGRPLSRTGV